MTDIYDDAITELMGLNATDIHDRWANATGDEIGSMLFIGATSDGHYGGRLYDPEKCGGCLTQIKNDEFYCAATKELTDAIREDHRLPCEPGDMGGTDFPKRKTLEVFAEWQRRLDEELDRDPEVMFAEFGGVR